MKAPRASEEGGARRLTLRVGSFRRCVALLREISGVDVGVRGARGAWWAGYGMAARTFCALACNTRAFCVLRYCASGI